MTAQWAVRAANGLRPQAKSNPAGRAKKTTPLHGELFFLRPRDSNGAVVNDSPVGCQSRERASPAGEVESRGARHRNSLENTKFSGLFHFPAFRG